MRGDQGQPVTLKPGFCNLEVVVAENVIQVQHQNWRIRSGPREMRRDIVEVEFSGKGARDLEAGCGKSPGRLKPAPLGTANC
jgi:hypothetical protein